jgi:hypothetical protein
MMRGGSRQKNNPFATHIRNPSLLLPGKPGFSLRRDMSRAYGGCHAEEDAIRSAESMVDKHTLQDKEKPNTEGQHQLRIVE